MQDEEKQFGRIRKFGEDRKAEEDSTPSPGVKVIFSADADELLRWADDIGELVRLREGEKVAEFEPSEIVQLDRVRGFVSALRSRVEFVLKEHEAGDTEDDSEDEEIRQLKRYIRELEEKLLRQSDVGNLAAQRLREQAKTIQSMRIGTVKGKQKSGRNDPCSCGSGKKFKKCCGIGQMKEPS